MRGWGEGGTCQVRTMRAAATSKINRAEARANYGKGDGERKVSRLIPTTAIRPTGVQTLAFALPVTIAKRFPGLFRRSQKRRAVRIDFRSIV